jgi:hypothetical protein
MLGVSPHRETVIKEVNYEANRPKPPSFLRDISPRKRKVVQVSHPRLETALEVGVARACTRSRQYAMEVGLQVAAHCPCSAAAESSRCTTIPAATEPR